MKILYFKISIPKYFFVLHFDNVLWTRCFTELKYIMRWLSPHFCAYIFNFVQCLYRFACSECCQNHGLSHASALSTLLFIISLNQKLSVLRVESCLAPPIFNMAAIEELIGSSRQIYAYVGARTVNN